MITTEDSNKDVPRITTQSAAEVYTDLLNVKNQHYTTFMMLAAMSARFSLVVELSFCERAAAQHAALPQGSATAQCQLAAEGSSIFN